MPRYRLIVEYDGAPFVGWQRQDNGPTVGKAKAGKARVGKAKVAGYRIHALRLAILQRRGNGPVAGKAKMAGCRANALRLIVLRHPGKGPMAGKAKMVADAFPRGFAMAPGERLGVDTGAGA